MNLPLSIIALALAIVTCHSATYYASPTGTDGAAGTLMAPISLVKALGDGAHSSPLSADDTLYLRGGIYNSSSAASGTFKVDVHGTIASPVAIRAYANEQPIIQSSVAGNAVLEVQVGSSNTWWYGIEFRNIAVNRTVARGSGLTVYGRNTKLIGCIIHDTGNGIGLWDDATPSEVNGCLIYNCGYDIIGDPRGHGHGIYSHAQPGGHRLRGNIIINPFDNGIQCYADTSGPYALADFVLEGNCAVHGPDLLSVTGFRDANFFIGGDSLAVTNLVFLRNLGYHAAGTSDNAVFGLDGNENANAIVASNYWSGGSFSVNQWTNIIFSQNTMVNPGTYLHYTPSAHVVSVSWNNNIYQSGFAWPFQLSGVAKTWVEWKSDTSFDAASTLTTSSLTTTNIFVRANDYAPTSGYIAIYNYGLKDNVSVDLSSIVSSGYTYTVRDAANYATVVKTGTYAGGLVTLPMTNLPPATPVGLSTPAASGPAFNAFLVTQGSRTGPLLRVTNLVVRNP